MRGSCIHGLLHFIFICATAIIRDVLLNTTIIKATDIGMGKHPPHPHIRVSGEPQRMNIQERLGVHHPALVECIELMESNIEQPLSPNELADLVGISKRQLERLFRRYLNVTPARYYLTLRLEAAREMLEKSTLKIIDVAIVYA